MSKKDFIESVFLALDPSVSAKEIQKQQTFPIRNFLRMIKHFLPCVKNY